MRSEMYRWFALPLLLCLPVAQSRNDATITPETKGPTVVEASIDIMEQTCVFTDDTLLMRRLSYVESFDGYHPKTYRQGYHGGIWQVDQNMFSETLKKTPYTRHIQGLIAKELKINWEMVSWDDLRMPLYSLLASRFYLGVRENETSDAIPRTIDAQATYWKAHYRPAGNKTDFIRYAQLLELACVTTPGADITFVIDGSASIGKPNFEKVKLFIEFVVNGYRASIDSGHTRVAVIQYSNKAKKIFWMNEYQTTDQIITAIRTKMFYIGGATMTHLALDMMVDQSFSEANGARPFSAGKPRIGIVMTDGISNHVDLTKAAAARVHKSFITAYSIGVYAGDPLDQDELTAIASVPDCMHLFLLPGGFDELITVKQALIKRSCRAPIPPFDPGEHNGRIDPGKIIYCKVVMMEGGVTVKVYTHGHEGTADFFIGTKGYPSEAYHDDKITGFVNRRGVAYVPLIPPMKSGDTVFCTINVRNITANVTIAVRRNDTNWCEPNPCQNDGECVDIDINGHVCICLPGYTGKNCESVIDPCNSDPCLHGGTCHPKDYNYQCECPPGFTGKNCETLFDPCDSDPCLNGGTCESLEIDYRCVCPPGYTGKNCETIFDPCDSDPCLNGGTCHSLEIDYRCICPPGFTGKNCESLHDPCDSDPCVNGGTCESLEIDYRCVCPPGYTGKNCEHQISDPCDSNPCLNGGTCRSNMTHYECICPPGYGGPNCEKEVNYDCKTRNPCTPENIIKRKFYWPHDDLSKFVQCDRLGQCFVHSCPPGLVFDRKTLVCVRPK